MFSGCKKKKKKKKEEEEKEKKKKKQKNNNKLKKKKKKEEEEEEEEEKKKKKKKNKKKKKTKEKKKKKKEEEEEENNNNNNNNNNTLVRIPSHIWATTDSRPVKHFFVGRHSAGPPYTLLHQTCATCWTKRHVNTTWILIWALYLMRHLAGSLSMVRKGKNDDFVGSRKAAIDKGRVLTSLVRYNPCLFHE